MNTRGFWELFDVADDALERSLRELLQASDRTEARIVAHLAELDARRLHLKAGGSSLFAYCLQQLGLSETEAFHRITAARLARRYPIIFELLAQRRLHLSAVCAVRRHINDENHAALLAEVCGKSKREIEELLAARFGAPSVVDKLRRLPPFEPCAEGLFRLHLVIDRETKEDLELARDLLAHANPNGDVANVVKRAVKLLLRGLKARRFGLSERPAKRPAQDAHDDNNHEDTEAAEPAPATTAKRGVAETKPKRTRAHLPHEVRRRVANDDELCCSFVAADGTRCGSRAFLQFHHVHAWSKGGPDSAQNLRLLCAAHNRLLAEEEFGAMASRPARARKRSAPGSRASNR
jgi:hypothetical protein